VISYLSWLVSDLPCHQPRELLRMLQETQSVVHPRMRMGLTSSELEGEFVSPERAQFEKCERGRFHKS
jgi:hypothetical protein